jgi:hypothetical protein
VKPGRLRALPLEFSGNRSPQSLLA